MAVKAIIHILLNDAEVQSLVGLDKVGATYKVYPNMAMQSESLPLVTVWQVSKSAMDCKGTNPTAFNYSYEIYSYSKEYEKAAEISEAINNALSNANVSALINGIKFTDKIRYENEKDGPYEEKYQCYCKILTFNSVTYEGAVT